MTPSNSSQEVMRDYTSNIWSSPSCDVNSCSRIHYSTGASSPYIVSPPSTNSSSAGASSPYIVSPSFTNSTPSTLPLPLVLEVSTWHIACTLMHVSIGTFAVVPSSSPAACVVFYFLHAFLLYFHLGPSLV